MTSTSVTTIGGVVVVTQVIPQDENTIQLQTAAPAPSPKAPPPPSPTKMDDMTATFLQGEPVGLGVVQIFVGVLCVLFSLTSTFSPVLLVHAPLCLSVFFLVSGALAVAAGRRASVRLVLASLVSNVIGSVFGLVGVAYVCWLLTSWPAKRFCDSGVSEGFDPKWTSCKRRMWMLDVGVRGSLGVLLVLLLLQVCVSITVCVFSGKAMRQRRDFVPLREDGDNVRALLSDDGEETSTSPPNSP